MVIQFVEIHQDIVDHLIVETEPLSLLLYEQMAWFL